MAYKAYTIKCDKKFTALRTRAPQKCLNPNCRITTSANEYTVRDLTPSEKRTITLKKKATAKKKK